MPRKIVHVVGTGTIGEPLIGLLADYRDQLGISEVTFNKNSAVKGDYSKINGLLRRGARLSVDESKVKDFKVLGIEFSFFNNLSNDSCILFILLFAISSKINRYAVTRAIIIPRVILSEILSIFFIFIFLILLWPLYWLVFIY